MSSSAQSGVGQSGVDQPGKWLTPTAALARSAQLRRFERGALARDQGVVRYGYRIDDIGLLIGERAGCEVIPVPVVARIPTTPPWLLGVANLRGSLVPIFDLRELLELPAARAGDDRLCLIFERGEQALGVPIARRPQPLQRLEPLRQAPPLPRAVRDFVTATYTDGAAAWLEFDHRRFFAHVAQRMAAGSSFGEST